MYEDKRIGIRRFGSEVIGYKKKSEKDVFPPSILHFFQTIHLSVVN